MADLREDPNRPMSEPQTERVERASRLVILPGDVTIAPEAKVIFVAVVYDEDDAPITPPNIRWRAHAHQVGEGRISSTGEFSAEGPGVFTISAGSDGLTAAITVTVEESNATRDEGKSEQVGTGVGAPGEQRVAGPVASLARGPGWDDASFASAFDPANHRGRSPTAVLASTHSALRFGRESLPADRTNVTGNRSFQFSVPVVRLPGRGIDLALDLHYDSLLWVEGVDEAGTEVMRFDPDGDWPALGWSLGFGRMLVTEDHKPMLVDGDGTRHDSWAMNSGPPGRFEGIHIFKRRTTDGSLVEFEYRVRYRYTGATGDVLVTTLLDGLARYPDGTVVDYNTMPGSYFSATRITEPNGNYINIAYRQGLIDVITDTLGRVIEFHYDSARRLTAITGPGLGGGRKTLVRLTYQPLRLETNYEAPGSTREVEVLQAIYFPGTNTGYWFGDEDIGGEMLEPAYSSYGMLVKVSERRGMSFSSPSLREQGAVTPGTPTRTRRYDYPKMPNPALDLKAPEYKVLRETWWAGSEPRSAATRFEVVRETEPLPGPGRRTRTLKTTATVFHPPGGPSGAGTRSVQVTDRRGRIISQELQDPNGNPLDTTMIEWDTASDKDTFTSPRPKQITRVERIAPRPGVSGGALRTKTAYLYGPKYNQVSDVIEYDYDGTTVVRMTHTDYEDGTAYAGRNVLNLPKAVDTYEQGWSVPTSRVEFTYDDPVPDPIPGEPDRDPGRIGQYDRAYNPHAPGAYDPATAARGNLTERRSFADAGHRSGGVVERFRYDFLGNLTLAAAGCCDERFEYGEETRYAFPTRSVRGAASPPEQVITTARYDLGTGLSMEATDADGRTTRFGYDPESLRALRIDWPTGATTYFFYDDGGMVVQQRTFGAIASPRDRGAEIQRRAYELWERGGRRTGRALDDWLAAEREWEQARQSAIRRRAYEIWEQQGRPNGRALGNWLAAEREWEDASRPDGEDDRISWLDGRGLVWRSATSVPDGWDVVELQYDNLGRPWKVSRPFRRGSSLGIWSAPADRWTVMTYDDRGRPVKVVAPDGSEAVNEYNPADPPRVAQPGPGQALRTTDPWGRQRWARTDSLGRLVEVVEPDPNDNGSLAAGTSTVTRYAYGPRGLQGPGGARTGALVEITRPNRRPDPDQVRRFCYDGLGRLTHQHLVEKDAALNDLGTRVSSGGVWSDFFTYYDNRSNLKEHTDARGVTTRYTYEDLLNRLQRIEWKAADPPDRDPSSPIAPAPKVEITYVPGEEGKRRDISRVAKITAEGVSDEEYGYDPDGLMTSSILTLKIHGSGQPQVTDYTYDSLGRLRTVRLPAEDWLPGAPRRSVSYDLDRAGRIQRVLMNGELQASEITYDAAGRVTSLKVGPPGPLQVAESYNYDEASGLLARQQLTRAGALLLDFSYDYLRPGTAKGRTGQLTRLIHGWGPAQDRTYEYDALGRLRKVTAGVTGAPAWTQEYTYDIHGNRLSVGATGQVPPDGIPSLAYHAGSNRIKTQGYAYDAAGNLIRSPKADGGVNIYQYDAAGRLVRVGGVIEEYVYGHDRRRLVREYSPPSAGGRTTYFWVGDQVVSDRYQSYSNTHSNSRSYLHLGGRLLATRFEHGRPTITGPGEMYYSHPDRLGTRLITTTPTYGDVVGREMLPFGVNPTEPIDPPLFPLHDRVFTSYERSVATGLDYAINRFYDPRQGRFVQVDPIENNASQPGVSQSLNLYAYVKDDPVNATDNLGLTQSSSRNRCATTSNGDIIDVGSSESCPDSIKGPITVWSITGGVGLVPVGGAGPRGITRRGGGRGVSPLIQASWRYVDSQAYRYNGSLGGANWSPLATLSGPRPTTDLDILAFQYIMMIPNLFGGLEFEAVTLGVGPALAYEAEIDAALITMTSSHIYRIPVAASEAGVPLESLTPVSRWGRPGLQPGDWVMPGPPNRLNYTLSFKWDPSPTNVRAPFRAGEGFMVPPESVRWPTGWGVDGRWKGIYGQRRYMWPP